MCAGSLAALEGLTALLAGASELTGLHSSVREQLAQTGMTEQDMDIATTIVPLIAGLPGMVSDATGVKNSIRDANQIRACDAIAAKSGALRLM